MTRAGLLLLGATACLSAHGAPPLHLHITTELSAPSSMMEGEKITGFATEKVREIMARSGIGYDIEMLPWKRAFLQAAGDPRTCVYSTTRTPEREHMFSWIGPTHANDWTLFARADRRFKLVELADAGNARIGAYNGDVRGDYLMARGFNVDLVQNSLSNPRKLLLGRIDLWATSMRVGKSVIAQNGWEKEIVPVLTFKRTQLYLACNPAVPRAAVRDMNAALAAMNRDGTAAAIERRFELREAPAR